MPSVTRGKRPFAPSHGRILHEHRYLLPVELQELKVIVAWRAPKKLGAMLIPYRFNSPTDEDTPLACVAVNPT